MKRLISDEMISHYLLDPVTIEQTMYEPIFRYVNEKLDTHVYEVGFRYPTGLEETAKIYVPSVREDGLLQRNRTLWYQVYMVIPPVYYTNLQGNTDKVYLKSILNESTMASKLVDFFPGTQALKPLGRSKLYDELHPGKAQDINDTSTWLAIDLATAIIEIFNMKIPKEMARSRRGGYKGISGAMRAIHTLITAFTRYHGDEDRFEYNDDAHDVDEFNLLGSALVEDRQGALIIHPHIKRILASPDTPIDFCSCSQSYPMVTARLKDGVHVENCRLVGEPTFPYTQWRRAIVGIKNDDPHRVIVSRAVSRALKLKEPDIPYARTETTLANDSLSMPGIRMSHPLNYEDGLVVSKSFAEKASAYKTKTERIIVPEGSEITIHKEPLPVGEFEELKNTPPNVMPGDVVATVTYRSYDPGRESDEESLEHNEIRSTINVPGVLTKVEKFVQVTDMSMETTVYRLVYYLTYPLSIGDKLSDGHGNKVTVSSIVEDERMPVWRGNGMKVRAHYIATPYIMKRLAVGAEIEDKMSLCGFVSEAQSGEETTTVVDSDEALSTSDVDELLIEEGLSYRGTVEHGGRTYDGVPLSLRCMFRLDNNAKDGITVRMGVELGEFGRKSRNIKLGLDLVTVVARNASLLAHYIIEQSGAKHVFATKLAPVVSAIEGVIPEGSDVIEVDRTIPTAFLGNQITANDLEALDKDGTVCDPRLTTHYGVIWHGAERFVIPPHETVRSLNNGLYMLSKTAIEANRLVAEILSYEECTRGDVGFADVKGMAKRYDNSLRRMLTGKSGLVRETLMPVFPHSIRAVASPYLGSRPHDPMTIMVPERELRRLCKEDENIRDRYLDRLEQGLDMWAIIKRDPVHRNQNMIGVKIKPWKRPTIGISPLLMPSFDGDFDGDEMTVMLVGDTAAYHEIEHKLSVSFADIFAPGKQVYNSTPERAYADLVDRIGWASTFTQPHESDIVKNPSLFRRLRDGTEGEEMDAERISAARDFEVVKDGTAFSGALGLTMIFTCGADERHLLDNYMELYHAMAQNTLDAKAGVPVPAISVVNGFRTNDQQLMLDGLSKLGFTDKECINRLFEVADRAQKARGRLQLLVQEYPALACMQKSPWPDDTAPFTSRLARKEHIGGGFWETVTEYLAEYGGRTPFDWSDPLPFLVDMVKTGSDVGHSDEEDDEERKGSLV